MSDLYSARLLSNAQNSKRVNKLKLHITQLFVAPLLVACSTTQAAGPAVSPQPQPASAQRAPAQPAPPAPMADHQHMAGMPGMAGMAGMSAPITIPKGANFTEADVRFMQGMIGHHSQAIYMSRLAVTRGASPRVLKFAQKIDQSQQAEIRLMQEWLIRNSQTAPDTGSWRDMQMSMPGMLTPAQLVTLDAAKGPEFDRQFLNLMIQHHEGALRMVDDLLATPRAAQDVDISVFATDVTTVQTAEIGIMRQMLANP